MHTKNSLLNDLHNMGIDPNNTLKVHISYNAIGDVDGRGDTVLDALSEYMQKGLLILPSHTWDNVGITNPVMDVLHTPSCVGKLTELFRKRKGVKRSLHPTHSVAALGKNAAEFVAGEEQINTPCGKNGTYYKLWESNAQILLIGVNFSRNTFVHGIEEWDGAESTISTDATDLYVIDYDGKRLHTPQHRHCAPVGSATFTKLEPHALNEGVMTINNFGDATARLMQAKPLRTMVAKYLKNNSRYLLRH